MGRENIRKNVGIKLKYTGKKGFRGDYNHRGESRLM